jgi:hypothetical protein
MPSTEYLIRLKSEDLTQYLRETATWVPGEKLEYDIDVTSTEEKTINFGDIDRIRFFAIFANEPVSITFVQGTNTIGFKVQDMLVFSPTKQFLVDLMGISVSALGLPAHVKIRIYGETPGES